MANINFPAAPATNDTYSFGGKTWVYNGSAWDLATAGAINGIVIGNVTPAAGTFTTLSATGNIVGSNITTGGLVSATGNVSGGNITTTGTITATANITGGNLTTTGTITATGNIASGANISTSGNIYSNNVIIPNQDQVLAYIFAF